MGGSWEQGTIYVGDVFRTADYNVRLKAWDANVLLQVDLILSDSDLPATYDTDEDLPVAVQQVAENTFDAIRAGEDAGQ